MKRIVLLILLALPAVALSQIIVPTYRPAPIIFVDENGEEWVIYPPFKKLDDGSVEV